MKYILTTLSIVLFLGHLCAQTIINGDFESWNDTQFESTLEWDNSNLENGFQVITLEITDIGAVEGSHAVYLETKGSQGEVQFGYTLLGQFGDDGPESGFAYEGTIDGMSASVQYDIQAGDSANAILIGFYEGSVVDMTVARMSGSQSGWVELNVEFTGATLVDEVLIAFASSNAMSDDDEAEFIAGSWIIVDNVQLTLNDVDMDVVPNGGFEEWEVISLEIPADWESNMNPQNDLVVKTTDAYEGNYAIKLENHMDPDSQEVTSAILTNGNLEEGGATGGQTIFSRPDAFIGFYKYGNNGEDVAFVTAQFFSNGELVGVAVAQLNPASEYQMFNQLVEYSSSETPDVVIISAFPGEEAGSTLYLDNLSFNFIASIEEDLINEEIELSVFPNPFSDVLNFTIEGKNSIIESLSMYDVTGKMILDFDPSFLAINREIASIDLSSMNSGTYLVVLRTDKKVFTETVIKK